jgi:hypothetical protein
VDLPVQPIFPSQYKLELTTPPPESVITRDPMDPSFGAAYGVLVAYEDLNDDGRLDLVPNDAGAFLDKIIATNTDLAIVYLESTTGSLPPGATANVSGSVVLGYNLLTTNCTPADGTNKAPDGGFCDWNVFLPISTPYDLPLSSDPTLNELMCQGYASGSGASGGGGTGSLWNVSSEGTPPGGYPAPGAPGLTCNADGMGYATNTCVTQQENLCTSSTFCTELDVVLAGAPVPAGWPCP